MNVFRIHKFFFISIFLFFISAQLVNAITISPARQGLVAAPGTVERVSVMVTNTNRERKVYVPEVDAFAIDPDTGRAVFGQSEEAIQWVAPSPRSITLEPGRKGTFRFTITIPKDVEVRSRYLAFFVREKIPEGGVAISSRVGSLLFLHISGLTSEQLVNVSFTSNKKILFSPRATFSLTLKNTGTIHLIPEGSVLVTKSGTTVTEFFLNPDAHKVLPGGLWKQSYTLQELSWRDIGKLDVIAGMKYGLTNQELFVRTVVWYVPWQALLVSAIIIFSAIHVAHKRKQRRRLFQ